MRNIKFTIGEMFSGPGGLGYASKHSNYISKNSTKYSFKHRWATDIDKDSCETYKNNIIKNNTNIKKTNDLSIVRKSFRLDGVFRALYRYGFRYINKNNPKFFCKDIHELDLDKLSYVDGFMYGFPCNDFSIVGKSIGLDGLFGPLYKYGVKYINKNNPKFFLAENVGGISSANEGEAFKKILYDLKHAGQGYNVTTHLYKFEHYGIPQRRHRYILVGFRKDLNLTFKVPAPTNNIMTAKEALEGNPIPDDASAQEITKQSNTVIERLKYIKEGENAWNGNIPKELQLNVKGAKLSNIYKRLDPNKPAYTITGSGGGGTHVYHWKENRALTNRERARLQTFPDNFDFFGNKESVRKQIGMAIPVKGAAIILAAILKTFSNDEYKYIEPSLKEDNQFNFKF